MSFPGGERQRVRPRGRTRAAEREGFEPSIEVDPLCRFSKPVPSATRPPLQSLWRALKLTPGMRLRTPAFRTYLHRQEQIPFNKPDSLERDMLIRMIGAVLVLAAGSIEANGRVTTTESSIDQLGWLAGCLEMRSGDRMSKRTGWHRATARCSGW